MVDSAENTEAAVTAPKDVTALLTPPLEDISTHPSNGKLAPQSLTQIPPSSPPASPPSDHPPLSDHHGYRFRCSRCSLAFPTQEKLQLHWQYHAMRAATECPLCSRQCRSQEALQRHMQNTHSQPDNAQGQNTLLPPHTAQYTEHDQSSVQQDFSLSPQVGQEAGESEDEEMEEEILDMEEKEQKGIQGEEKDAVDEGAAEHSGERGKEPQEDIPEPTFSSLVKKSFNPAMDRFLDPARPYKCTICSESFTQKTILLVHYNSVSHLHRARRALQDSNAGVAAPEAPRGPDSRPYRCQLCGVGYSQSSTLDIHLRSVLHQTRARAAQNSGSQTPTSSVAAPASFPSTATQPVTAKEEPSKSFPLTKKPDVVSSSASALLGVAAEVQSTLSNSTDQSVNQHTKKRVADLLASRNQLMLLQQQQLAQVQAQAQAQLQQTTLLQSQLLQHFPLGQENLLKQPFSLIPESMLSLQQQLLLPFYFSGDVKMNPELAFKSHELGQLLSALSIPKEQLKAATESESQPQFDDKMAQETGATSAVSKPQDHVPSEPRAEAGTGEVSKTVQEESAPRLEEQEDVSVPANQTESQKEATNPSVNLGLQCPPPRVPFAAMNGEPLRALLQSYGYELALQYIQNRHRNQQEISSHLGNNSAREHEAARIKMAEMSSEEEKDDFTEVKDSEMADCVSKEEDTEEKRQKSDKESLSRRKECCERGKRCMDCGKLFSDALVLKSHKEYIHRTLFPTAALERFSREYRQQYDQMYPLTEHQARDNSASSPQATATSSTSELELAPEIVAPPVKPHAASPVASVSDSINKTRTSITATSAPTSSPPCQTSPQQEVSTLASSTDTSQSTTSAQSIPVTLPKIPMLPLSLPQLPIPPLTLPTLPFPIELPLLPPVVMPSVALHPQPWLDSSVNPELAKLYQSQFSPALLGKQPQLSPALLTQQSQLSPALQAQPPQLSPVLLGQSSQTSPSPTGPSQVSATLQQSKRTRTRISEEQLTILRKHFDINSLPSDDDINKMSALSGLPNKVIKHWFRNTLFKERQRDKDSPYNFNNPPTIALEESSEEVAQDQSLALSPCSLSPGLPANSSPLSQASDLQRGEPHRGRRSSRTRFTEKQLETLQGMFEVTPYPREEEYDRLSALLSLPNRVIVVWFQNARQRARKSQDKETDDGSESKSSQRRSLKDNDEEDIGCGHEGHGEAHSENSLDLTYEYYTNPESPVGNSSPAFTEGEHPIVKDETAPVTRKQEDTKVPPLANKSPGHVRIQKESADAGTHHVQDVQAVKTEPSSPPEPSKEEACSPETPQPCSSSSSQKPAPNNLSVSHSSRKSVSHNSPSDHAGKKPADTSASTLAAPDSKTHRSQPPDAAPGVSVETQPKKGFQPQSQAQFQCSLCPASLPTFQLWQEHHTRHVLAAQTQVQFLHSGFTERALPYMMLHPNHPLVASQMLSGAMSQMHPSPSHPVISHLNSIQMKNTMSDHSSPPLTCLAQGSMTPIKQNPKLSSDNGFDAQRGSRDVEEEHRRDKRQRTTITPEQLEVLYQRYSIDSNPTRGVLESIARDVGLTRRVVQVVGFVFKRDQMFPRITHLKMLNALICKLFLFFSIGLVSKYTSQREKRAVSVDRARVLFQFGFQPPALPLLSGSL